MRFHMTMPFSTARKAYEAAADDANEEFDKDLGRTPEYKALLDAETSALRAFMIETPAATPTELADKIKLYSEREMAMWTGGEDYLNAILRDCATMQDWPLSPEFARQWAAWRKLGELLQGDLSAEDEKHYADLQAQGYCQIAMANCTTPGDFILKQYMRLHTTNGSTFQGAAKDDGTGNAWDIDIDDHSDEARFETADKLGCYDDINHTDIGMHLLAYGLPYFDAKAWMERADAVGLKVDLCVQRDGREGIHVGMLDRRMIGIQEDNDDTPETPIGEKVRRERDRLRRILAHPAAQRGPDGGKDRIAAIADEIRENWPKLVWRAPDIIPQEKLAEVLKGEPAVVPAEELGEYLVSQDQAA